MEVRPATLQARDTWPHPEPSEEMGLLNGSPPCLHLFLLGPSVETPQALRLPTPLCREEKMLGPHSQPHHLHLCCLQETPVPSSSSGPEGKDSRSLRPAPFIASSSQQSSSRTAHTAAHPASPPEPSHPSHGAHSHEPVTPSPGLSLSLPAGCG